MPDIGVSGARLTGAAWAVGVVMMGLTLWSPYLVSGYHNPAADLVLDTINACIALLAAYLVYGRFVRLRRLQDLFLVNGLVLLAVPGLGLTYAAQAASAVAGTLDVWLPLAVRLMGGILIAVAALSKPGRVGEVARGHSTMCLPAAVTAVVTAVTLVLWSARLRLPVALNQAQVPSAGREEMVAGAPLLAIAQGVAAVCFFAASIAFASQSTRRGDEILRWLGPACVLGGFAGVYYMVFPAVHADWLNAGDLLRTGCYVLAVVGATRELRQYWSAHSRAAVLDDRRRLARELHDGVIQELVYIRSESHSRTAGVGVGDRIVSACDRALDEARAAVQALARGGDEPLGFMLHRAARELAEKYAVSLEVDLDDSISAQPDQKQALIRITREAVSNAVRHGKAGWVAVRLSREGGLRHLAIQDDGDGFDIPATVAANAGYGLVSMRDRATALPGFFEVEAATGRGSVVTVRW